MERQQQRGPLRRSGGIAIFFDFVDLDLLEQQTLRSARRARRDPEAADLKQGRDRLSHHHDGEEAR